VALFHDFRTNYCALDAYRTELVPLIDVHGSVRHHFRRRSRHPPPSDRHFLRFDRRPPAHGLHAPGGTVRHRPSLSIRSLSQSSPVVGRHHDRRRQTGGADGTGVPGCLSSLSNGCRPHQRRYPLQARQSHRTRPGARAVLFRLSSSNLSLRISLQCRSHNDRLAAGRRLNAIRRPPRRLFRNQDRAVAADAILSDRHELASARCFCDRLARGSCGRFRSRGGDGRNDGSPQRLRLSRQRIRVGLLRRRILERQSLMGAALCPLRPLCGRGSARRSLYPFSSSPHAAACNDRYCAADNELFLACVRRTVSRLALAVFALCAAPQSGLHAQCRTVVVPLCDIHDLGA